MANGEKQRPSYVCVVTMEQCDTRLSVLVHSVRSLSSLSKLSILLRVYLCTMFVTVVCLFHRFCVTHVYCMCVHVCMCATFFLRFLFNQ